MRRQELGGAVAQRKRQHLLRATAQRGVRQAGRVADETPARPSSGAAETYALLASSAIIQACACLASSRNDSISDGLRRVVLGEIPGFGLGECVESIAGCGDEVGFDILESFTDLGQQFGGKRHSDACARNGQFWATRVSKLLMSHAWARNVRILPDPRGPGKESEGRPRQRAGSRCRPEGAIALACGVATGAGGYCTSAFLSIAGTVNRRGNLQPELSAPLSGSDHVGLDDHLVDGAGNGVVKASSLPPLDGPHRLDAGVVVDPPMPLAVASDRRVLWVRTLTRHCQPPGAPETFQACSSPGRASADALHWSRA